MVSKAQKTQILSVGFTGVVLGVGLIPVGASKAQAASDTLPIVSPAEAHEDETTAVLALPEVTADLPAPEADHSRYVAVVSTWLADATAQSTGETIVAGLPTEPPTEPSTELPTELPTVAFASDQAPVAEAQTLPNVTLPSPGAAAVLVMPEWQQSPAQIAYNQAVQPSLQILAESNKAQTEAGSQPLVMPDWLRSPVQIADSRNVVISRVVSSDPNARPDQRLALLPIQTTTLGELSDRLSDPNAPLTWSTRSVASPVILSDRVIDPPESVAVSPTWTNPEYSELTLPVSNAGERFLLGSDRTVPRLAISSPGLSDPNQVIYDVRSLPQIAITPMEMASADEAAIAVSAQQVDILTPQSGAILNIPSTPVTLRFPVGAKIALIVNGQLIDSSQVGRTETDPNTQLRIQTWYGIPLEAGDNLIEVISTETGQVFASAPIIVRGQPEELTLFAPQTLPADGSSTATIRGQLVDGVGISSVWNTTVTLNASDGRFLGADQAPDQPGFQVPVINGEFSAELQSSLTSHLVQLQAATSGFETFRQIQFITPQRPTLISGVVDLRFGARGTDYYSSRREFLPLDRDNSYALDVNAAVFATGNLGEWLYTGAYNSRRPLNENCQGESGLFQTEGGSCDNTYPTTGDGSYSEASAPSLDSVYLRLERTSPSNGAATDYALWGDYGTEEFATAAQFFTATSRQFHGFKANYNFGNLAVTGLYANNVEGFQRDTLAPDGTSGFYFTSLRNIVPGSENVYFEVEELERPGTVLERRQLSRGLDYDIDYDRGTLLFNDPVRRTDINNIGQLLVRRIVTTYQYEGGGNTNVVAGRLQYDLDGQPEQNSWLGTSYFNEAQGDRNFTLYGADTRIALGESAQLIAEIAQSSSSFASVGNAAGSTVSGTAYRLEIDGNLGDRLTARSYFRSTGAGFTNAATTSFVPGQTRYGADIIGQLTDTTALRARFDHEDNFGVAPQVTDLSPLLAGFNNPLTNPAGTPLDNSLTTYSLGVTQKIGASTAEVDWIHRDRSDRLSTFANSNVSTDQLRSRFTTPLAQNLTFVAQNELNLSSAVDPIYPSRTLLGLNWEALPWLNVGVNQIFYGGGGNNRGSSTSIDVSGEHTFASNTTVRGRLSAIDGSQVGGSIGLEQGINLAPGLDLDLGYEKVFSTLGNATAAGTQLSESVAGANASALALAGGESYSVGLSYSDNPSFQASSRFEHRTSTNGSNTVFTLSAVGRLTPDLTILGDYRLANAANQNITGLGTTSLLKLGLAYRNLEDDRFNALLRYEYRLNPNSIPSATSFGTSSETQEHLLAAEAIYAPNWQWELYGKYAVRNSSTSIDGASGRFAANSTVQLAQARATYRLGYKWDVVGEARWLGGDGYSETGFAIETGYYPLPDLRVSAGYSAGAANDRDFGNNRSAGGFYFGITAKLSGLLNGFGSQPTAPYQQVPSSIAPSVTEVSATEMPAGDMPIGEAPTAEAPSNRYPTATEL